MPYANPEDKKQHDKEYKEKNKELIKEKRKEYNQRPEVKEKKKEYMKEYAQIQRFKKRQEIGEESWYKGQLMGFDGSCAMYYSNVLNIEYKKDEYEIYRHSRNHEFLHMIYLKNKAYESWLENGFTPPAINKPPSHLNNAILIKNKNEPLALVSSNFIFSAIK